ncbi:MAG: hypothetical protein GKR99_16465 [Rhodobacteraceae bacterium]|nr:hypothetical protein [Paracoccaceae bacterium]
MSRVRFGLIWAVVAIIVFVPIAAAMRSPLLAWRDPVYIAGGLAGVPVRIAFVNEADDPLS